MKLMEGLFTAPAIPQNQSYPVVVTPAPNGFIMNAVDFDDLSVEADNIQYGLGCIQAAISERLVGTYPPTPTPYNEIVLDTGGFVIMVTA